MQNEQKTASSRWSSYPGVPFGISKNIAHLHGFLGLAMPENGETVNRCVSGIDFMSKRIDFFT